MSYSQYSKFILLFIFAALVGCGRTLDTAKIEDTIKSSITKQGGISIKSIICPANVKPAAGANFECTGILDSGAGFSIAVKQQDDQGNIFWEAPSVKGLLNMAQLQTELEQGLNKEIGRVSINCGSANAYRSVKPGEMFECQLLKRDDATKSATSESSTSSTPQAAKPNDIIQVTIQPSGDINWQRIIRVADSKLPISTQKTTESTTPEATKTETSKPEISNTEKAPPAAKSPEDFLNQPGAADDFN
ncbi:MAG: hypothetical protein C4288_17550 [Leptolyngbya sp. ERB_1_1]